MAKPGTLPRWTSVTAGNRTEPISALKDSGWIPGDRPSSKHLNWLLYTIYLWLKWLDDTIGTDIAAVAWAWTGNQTWAGSAQFNGAVTFTNSSVEIGNGATLYGTILVKNALTLDSAVNLVVSATGLLDVNGDIDIAGTQKFATSLVRRILGMDFIGGGADWSVSGGSAQSTSTPPAACFYPLDLEEGETVTITVECKHTDGTAGNIVADLRRYDNAGTGTSVASVGSAATTARQTIALATNHAVVAGASYRVEVAGAGVTAQTRNVYQVVVSRKRV